MDVRGTWKRTVTVPHKERRKQCRKRRTQKEVVKEETEKSTPSRVVKKKTTKVALWRERA